MSFWGELRRRSVFKVGASYGVVAWVLIQVSVSVFPMLNLPAWAPVFVTVVLITGFPIALILAWAYEITPEGVKRDAESKGMAHPTDRHGASFAIGKRAIANSKAAIAVLPLRTFSSDEDDVYMARGISSEIAADLAKVPEIRVASPSASFSFQGDSVDLSKVADVLSIRYVLTGTFQRLGDRIRVMIELTDAREKRQMWAARYDREVGDLFAVQDEMAAAIVGAIGGELKLADTRMATSVPTKHLDAWGLVQKAFNFWLTTFDQRSFDDSLTLLRRAVKIDPKYAGARASLAMILSQRVINAMSEDEDRDREECLDMIEKAVQLDPSDLTVLENAGLVWTHHGQGPRGAEVLRQAVQLAPLDLIAWGYLAFNLGLTGTNEEAEESIEILDYLVRTAPKHPSMPYWAYFKAMTCSRLGRPDEGIEAGLSVTRAQPGFYLALNCVANLYGMQGKHDLAREAWTRANAINPLITPQFYARTLRKICMTEERTKSFIAGLSAAGILEVD